MRPSTVSQWLLTSPLSEKIEDVSLQEKMGEKGEVREKEGEGVRGRKEESKKVRSIAVCHGPRYQLLPLIYAQKQGNPKP